MLHLPDLISDLGLILIAAALVTVLFKKLKQPVVLGYLIAGFLVSPHFSFLPTVKDTANIKIWAEIGVIFLLFGLGLEFSFKKLAKVGKSAATAGGFEVLFMMASGFLLGRVLGWSIMDSLFLGGIVSISSTAIIVRAFDELKLKGQGFVSMVFGILVVEDIIAILLLVLLTSIALTQTLSGVELVMSSTKLFFFIATSFLVGIYWLPNLFRKIKEHLSEETLLIFSIGLCLMMVIIASKTGFSAALGAFMMGSLLAETKEGKRIEHLILPVKDFFSAIFFVSVGMLIDPVVLKNHFGLVLLISGLVIVCKFVGVTIGTLVSGRSLKTSVQTSLSLTQIGEFSFIIATLGMTLQVTSDFLYPVAVAVSAVTTFTTPYLIQRSEVIFSWIEKKLPLTLKEGMARYEIAANSPAVEKLSSLLWTEYGVKVLLNSVIVVAIALASSQLLVPWIKMNFVYNVWVRMSVSLGTFFLTTPFLWGIAFGPPSHTNSYSSENLERLEKLQIGILFVRFLFACTLAGFVLSQFTMLLSASGFLVVGVILSAISLSRYAEPVYKSIESKFISNLTENERAALEKEKKKQELAPWNASLAEFVVSPFSDLVGKSLHESKIKEIFGVMVTMIERAETRILAPQRETILWPQDRLFVIGTDEQLKQVKEILEKEPPQTSIEDSQYGLAPLKIQTHHYFCDKSIRDCGLREAVKGLIVGLERDEQRILNPDSSTMLKEQDVVWIVGDLNLIKEIANE